MNEFVTEDLPPLGAPSPEFDHIAGPQRIMLTLAALGGAVFLSAMCYLLIVMQ
jgi:hypothetical protein